MDLQRTFNLMVLGTFLSSFFLLYECKKLHGYKFPVYTTTFCPRNKAEMEKKSSEFGCKGESSYACLPNENITELLEFCYPQEVISIHHDICLYLSKDTSKVDYYDCTHFEHGCPTGPYFGSTIYEYPSCVSIGNGCFLAELSCKSATESPVQGNSPPDTRIIESRLTHLVWIGPSLSVIVLGLILAFVFRRRLNTTSRGDEEHASMSLLNKNNETDHKESEYEALTIRQWQEDDKLFVSTKAAENVDSMIKTNNIVMVTGHSGSGKSAIIQHIALQYREKGWVVKPTNSAKEIYQAYKNYNLKENRLIFVFHDPIGKESFDEIRYNELIQYWDSYLSIENVKILFTSRKSIIYDQKAHGLLKEKLNIVDINNIKHKLTNEEKKLMFKKHVPDVQPSEVDLAQIFEIDMYFPLLCKLFSVKSKQTKNKLNIFKEPIAVLKQEIESYKNKDKEKYCALVCLILNNNVLCLNDLEEKQELFIKSLRFSELPTHILPSTIIKKLKLLDGFFVKKIGAKYSFYHDYIMEVTTYVLGSENPKLLIQYADISFLRTRITLRDCKCNNPFTIFLNDVHIVDLVDRLFEELLGDHFMEVVLNPCLRNKRVTSGMIKKLENLVDQRKLELIIKAQTTYTENQKLKHFTNKRWYSRFAFATSESKLSPLFALIVFGHDDLSFVCLNLLRQRNFDLGQSCLFVAVCSNGNEKLIPVFTEEEISESLKEEWDSMYPIHIVSVFHNYHILEYMIEKRMDMNILTSDQMRWTSLILASANDTEENNKSTRIRRDETVKRLIQGGADINLCNNDGDSPLWIACQNGNESTAQLLLNHGADVNLRNDDGASSLWIVCQNGHESTAKLLLNHGVEVNLCDNNGHSPLWIACQNGHESTAQLLINHGADVNLCNNDGEGPLWMTCQNGHERTAQLLLIHGADVNSCNNDGDSPLWITCQNGNESTAQLLINHGADVNLRNDDGASPLWIVCQNGHVNTAQVLLNHGADVNLSNRIGISLLWIACYEGHERIARLLLIHDANVNLCSNDGDSPLWIACQIGHENTAKVLLNHGANINLCNNNGDSPLWIACCNGQESTAQLLLNHSAGVNLCDNDGKSPLWISCCNGYESTARLLLNHDAGVNLCNKRGVSPLIITCYNGHESTAQLLLNNSADVNLCNKDGEGPLWKVCQNGHESTVQLLLNHGADVNMCNKYGIGPLYKALQNDQDRIVQLLHNNGAEVNSCDIFGTGPLLIACEKGHDNNIQVLLNQGANVNLCNKKGVGPLWIACYKGMDSTAELLLKNGADVNLCDNDGFSPISIASLNNHVSCAQLLMNYKADVNLCNNNGASPLYIACQNGHDDIAKLLLKNGAEVNLCDKNRESPLYVACKNGHANTAQLLLESGADVNLSTDDQFSPFLVACLKNNDGCVELLLQNKADVNIISKHGIGPLFIACANGNDSIAQLLLNHGADVNLCDNDGVGPLWIACQNGHESTAELLMNNGADVNLSYVD